MKRRRPSMWQALLDGFMAIGEGFASLLSFGLYQPRRRYTLRNRLYPYRYKTVDEALKADYQKVEKDMEKVLNHFPKFPSEDPDGRDERTE